MTIGRQMAVGAAWLVTGRLLVRAIGLISTMILARLLVPDDFGLIALAMSVVAILEVMSAFSFDLALIADRNAGRADYDAAWSMGVIKGLIAGGILLLGSHAIANFFADERLITVSQTLALFTIIRGFENIGVVDFRRDLSFNREFWFNVHLKLIGFIATIGAAVILRDYRALLIGLISQAIGRVVLSYIMSPYRPSWDLAHWRKVMRFSKWLLINNILILVNQRSATFLIGKFHGIGSVGMFSIAEEISNLVTTELVSPVQRAVFPGYAKLAADLELLRENYLNVLSLVAMLAFPISTIVVFSAEDLVMVFLGQTWSDITPLIPLLTIAGSISMCCSNGGSVFMAVGQPNLIAVNAALLALIRLPFLVYTAIYYDIVSMAYVLIFTSFLMLIFNFVSVSLVLKIPLLKIGLQILRPVTAALTAGITLSLLSGLDFGENLDGHLIKIVVHIVAGFAAYSASITLLWFLSGRPDGAERAIGSFLLETIGPLRARLAKRRVA